MRHSDVLIYFAAPLFNQQERHFNERLVHQLEHYVDVFLPQRDGTLLVDMLAVGVPQSVAERRVFEQDCKALIKANLLIAVLDGGHIDEGVAFEIGFAHALHKPCIGLQTDVRRALRSGNNPMIAQGLSEIFSNSEALVAWIVAYATKYVVEGGSCLMVFVKIRVIYRPNYHLYELVNAIWSDLQTKGLYVADSATGRSAIDPTSEKIRTHHQISAQTT